MTPHPPTGETRWRCRRCQTANDGMGTQCGGCGTPQRIPVRFANGHTRYLPRGMTFAQFDDWLDDGAVRSADNYSAGTPTHPADSEVTTAQIAEILTTHTVGKSDMDCDEGCCWQHYCTCGALIYPTLEDHIAAVLLASFELVPKGQLHQETATEFVWVPNDPPEMDDRHVAAVLKGSVKQIAKVRLVGPWRPA